MPYIRIRGVEEQKIIDISKNLVDDLQKLIGCAREALSIEVIHTTFISDNEIVKGSPMIEVLWVDRGKETQDKMADIIFNHLSKVGIDKPKILVSQLDTTYYYKK